MNELREARSDSGPLFEAVGATLRREIASGRFALADVLPAERELCEILRVSRTTLRRAIAALIEEGLLFHRHGAGTFVRRRPPHVEQALSRLTSFTEDMRSRGFVASSREIERGVFLPTPEEAMMLGVSPRDSVFRLVRQRLADGVPLAMERAAVPARFFSDPSRVGDSLYAALDAEGWLPVRALQRLRAVVLGAADAALLGVAEGSAALDIHRIAYLADGRCVEYTRSFYRSDTYDFVAELTLSPGASRQAEDAPR